MLPTTRTASGNPARYLSGIATNSRIRNDEPSRNAASRNCLSSVTSSPFRRRRASPFRLEPPDNSIGGHQDGGKNKPPRRSDERPELRAVGAVVAKIHIHPG